MPSDGQGGLLYRLSELERTVQRLDAVVETQEKALTRLEEQIGGERGLSSAVNALAAQTSSLRKAAWWLVGIIVTASIGFAFGVLALIPA